MSNLEDRARRNNIRVRGIPESVPPAEFEAYLLELLQTTMPEAQALELTVDRIHRLPKPKAAPDKAPIDVIQRLLFFKTKEQLLTLARKKEGWPPKFQHLEIYNDLSRATLQKLNAYHEITATSTQHPVPLGLPVKPNVLRNGNPVTLTTLEEAKKALGRWNIKLIHPEQRRQPHTSPPSTKWPRCGTRPRRAKRGPWRPVLLPSPCSCYLATLKLTARLSGSLYFFLFLLRYRGRVIFLEQNPRLFLDFLNLL